MKNMAKLIVSFFAVFTVLLVVRTNVYASDNCDENYGGGETCLVNKRFKIEKWVRQEGEHKDESCKEWDEEVTLDLTDGDDKDDYLEFCIRVTNLSDDEGDFDFDDMKLLDKLPSELYRIGGDGLTEYWDDFDPGESKDFKIKVRIDEDELDKDGEYEKCAVNRALVYWDGEFEGSDTATVCWKNYDKEIKELPKTGAESFAVALGGATLAALGAFLKKKK